MADRKPDGTFAENTSGNPGGRNPERERLRKYILESFGQESIDGIAELARSARSEKVKLEALEWLAEQAVGKAIVAISGPDGGPLEVDASALGGALKKLAGGG